MNLARALIFALALSACANLPRPTPTLSPQLPTAPSVPALTLEQIQNAQYSMQARDDHPLIQLRGGKYQQGENNSTDMNFAYIGVTQFAAFGDLTGDGAEDAAVMMLENFGGTGNFAILAVFANVNGYPVFLTARFIDDRPLVNALSIEGDEIFLDAVIHSFQDGGCCPTLPSAQRFALAKNQLRLTHFATATADGKIREIEIRSPAGEAEASGSVTISGKVSIAPFENNLAYRIYNEMGEELSAGPIPVRAADFGAPGDFEAAVSLADVGAGSFVFLEIQDISMADGSLLAMDTLKVRVK